MKNDTTILNSFVNKNCFADVFKLPLTSQE